MAGVDISEKRPLPTIVEGRCLISAANVVSRSAAKIELQTQNHRSLSAVCAHSIDSFAAASRRPMIRPLAPLIPDTRNDTGVGSSPSRRA